jgi:hypothetical protein
MWKWFVGAEEKGQTTNGSRTDAIPKATTGLYKIRMSKKCGYKGKLQVQSIVGEIQTYQKNLQSARRKDAR